MPLPVGPDPIVRARVRRVCRALINEDPWVDSDPTPAHLARLALLRCLDLQREVRRAAQTGQHTAAAVLARSSVESCLLGAYFLCAPKDQVDAMQRDLGSSMVKLLTHVADPLFGDGFVKETAEAEFGKASITPLRAVADTVDAAGLIPAASGLYNAYFVPLAILYSHTTGLSLLRQAAPTAEAYRRRAWRAWGRRSPMHLADASVALLALTLEPTDSNAVLLRRYAASHRRRALPIVVTLMGRLFAANFSLRHLPAAVKGIRELQRSAASGELAAMSQKELRQSMLETVQRMSRVVTGREGDPAMQDRLLDALETKSLPEAGHK